MLLEPQAIFPENVKDVVADGFTTAEDLCTTAALKKACAGERRQLMTSNRRGTAARSRCCPCAGSTRASAPCRCCATSISTPTPGRGHRARRRQRRRQEHADQVRRRHPPVRRRARCSSRASRSTIHGPKDANALGIEVVYQDLALCDNLDVVHNMFLGREMQVGHHAQRDRDGEARRGDAERRSRCGRCARCASTSSSLSGGQRQTVAIARAVLWNSQARDPRRADRRARRRPDRAGAQAGPPARGERARR